MVTITLQGSSISEIRAQMRDFLGLDVETVGQAEIYGKSPYQLSPETLSEAREKMRETGSTHPGARELQESPVATNAAQVEAEKPKRKRRTKAEIEAAKAGSNGTHAGEDEEESAENESPAIVQINKQAPVTAAPIVNKEAVHQALQQVNVAVGLPKAREILQAFGVNRISEIKEDQYKPFIEKCNEAVMMEG